MGPTGPEKFGDILVNQSPLKNVPKCFEINEDKMNENIYIVSEFYAMFFLVMLKKNL